MLDQGRSAGGGNGSPLRNSCVEASMDRGASRVTVVLGVPRRRRNSAHTGAPGFAVHGRLRLAWGVRQPRGSASQVALDTDVPRGLAPRTGPAASLPAEPEVRSRPQKSANLLSGLVARPAPFPAQGPQVPVF